MTTLEIVILCAFGETFFISLPALIGLMIAKRIKESNDEEDNAPTYYDITHWRKCFFA